jgi:hypothetical protein
MDYFGNGYNLSLFISVDVLWFGEYFEKKG